MTPGVLAARLAVWAHQRLRAWVDRLAPPELLLAERITGVARTALAGALVSSGLAERLDDTPRSARDLVGDGALELDVAQRILRGAAAVGLLDRGAGGFRRNRLTRLLDPEGSRTLGPLAAYFASASNLQAWSRFLDAVRAGEVPFRRAHGRGVWEHLAASEEEGARFARAMDALTRLDAETVVRTPGFSGVAGLCDVAGGTGALLEAALRAHPGLEGVLVDAPVVVQLARRRFERSGLLGRVRLEPADVFARVPEGLPAYVLKDVLHDWDDARALALLEVVRRAMPPGARLLLVEVLLEDGPVDALAALVDLQMLAVTDGGRQRSVGQLAALLGRAGFGPPVVHRTRTANSVLVSQAV
ncbi:MAG TPA: methyltransferase [Myxococcaceae bacterium]|nr:methyltransferase [Myxococcaceae bacterium]